jgi:hypothetical protein
MAKKQKAPAPGHWRNRICGHGMEAPDQLLANPQNWRVHPQFQQDNLQAVLDRVGWVQQVLVNQRTGHMVDGHLRVMLAMKNNEPTLPVTYVDLDEEEEALILATLDPISSLAVTDAGILRDLVADIQLEDGPLKLLLDDLLLNGSVSPVVPPSADELAQSNGAPDLTMFWPEIKLKVEPETHERFTSLMASMVGPSEPEKFAALLERVSL